MWPGPSNNQIWPGPNTQPSQPKWQGGNSERGMWGTPQDTSGLSAPGWNSPAAAAQGNMTVPYEQRLSNGIQDKVITITGTVKSNPDKLTVDLSAGRDLAFHFNPRFKDEANGRVIVMNSCLGQQWGREERDSQHFPLAPGQPFQIKIHCIGQGFQVQVNQRDLPTYRHRTDPRSIDTLRIYNDLLLSSVTVK